MEARIAELEAKLAKLEGQLAKHSGNSSKPPSSDGYRRGGKKPAPKSLRRKRGRRPGGQPGHTGRTLEPSSHPDSVERHAVTHCAHCKAELSDTPVETVVSRQVWDVPEPQPVQVTEHQAEKKRCPHCRKPTRAAFPAGAVAPVQYGARIRALAVYLHSYQLLPLSRSCEALWDLTGVSISEGTLAALVQRTSEALERHMQVLRAQVTQAAVGHFDESGCRVSASLWWLHVASTEQVTCYAVHPKRGREALDDIGILPAFTGRAIHDCWQPYQRYTQCAHGLCNAHLLRELVFVHEQLGQAWARAMGACLVRIKRCVDTARATGRALATQTRLWLTKRYQRILAAGFADNPLPTSSPDAPKSRGRPKKSKPRNLLERLDLRRDQVLAFFEHPDVPFDNNLAERDVRMVKVQQKVSGTFRSEQGAQAFCRLRSVLSTGRKRGLGALEVLSRLEDAQLFALPETTT